VLERAHVARRDPVAVAVLDARGASRSVDDSSGASGGEYDASIAGEPSLSS